MRNSGQQTKVNNLKGMAQFVLFTTSYIPLFILIACKQISENFDFLSWGGLNFDAFFLCIQKFGLTIIAIIFSIFGFWGYKQTFKNLERVATNGDNVTVTYVDNKNSESIGYIATYIVPFLFQSFNGWYETFALIFLMIIIYRIYINSNLILINPVLSFKYSIFQIEYTQQDGKSKNALVISKNKYLSEDSVVKIYEIGFKLFYVKHI
ncbi:MAG: hypothetical protein LBH32_01415 [Dysgonamonadaceae bacterium]|jgi:hypothetical protein|nr:hypothetical protein [Dysgonamonadaceae bacterium]